MAADLQLRVPEFGSVVGARLKRCKNAGYEMRRVWRFERHVGKRARDFADVKRASKGHNKLQNK
jgi:hypothetical protein